MKLAKINETVLKRPLRPHLGKHRVTRFEIILNNKEVVALRNEQFDYPIMGSVSKRLFSKLGTLRRKHPDADIRIVSTARRTIYPTKLYRPEEW